MIFIIDDVIILPANRKRHAAFGVVYPRKIKY